MRGCQGSLRTAPLHEAIASATAAALSDPRHAPLADDERRRARVRATLLGALVPCEPMEAAPGRHGLYVELGARRGLLLPEHWGHYGHDAARFVEGVARKAGIDAPEASRARWWRFEAVSAEAP